MKRYLREAEGWNQHLERCRSFISGCFIPCPAANSEKEVLAVLGSGWLLDVPLEDLQKRFGTIVLADLHHPVQIRKKVERMDNVILLDTDLSGGAISRVCEFAGNARIGEEQFLRELNLAPPLGDLRPTALASVNLLSQLNGLLYEYLERTRRLSSTFEEDFRRKIQEFHLDWISRIPGCLVTDVREIHTNRKGVQEIKELLGCPLPAGIRQEKWTWEFDREGNYRSGRLTRMEVSAVQWG